jgi:myo-inositol-1(or 4)-monophosphatase
MTVTDIEVAITAVSAAGEVLRRKYGTELTRQVKTPLDFATDADVDAERAIIDVIRAARPGDRIVAEESGSTGEVGSERVWLVDPLCGTINYAAHTPLVAVNVALKVRGETTTAVCGDPLAGELMWTDGDRAHRRYGARDQELRASADSRLVDVNLDGPFPNERWFRAVDLLREPAFSTSFRPRVSSTSLALAWVAAGRRAAYVSDGDVHDSVHFASALALCAATGCVLTGLEGQPLAAGVGLVAAADPLTHRELLVAIAAQTR